MQSNYWTSVLRQRVTRRRAVIGTSSAAGAAAFLAACGGDDSDETPTSKSDLVTESKDTTAQAVRGGTLRSYLTSDIPSLDPSAASFPLNFVAGYAYGTLINEKPGHLGPPQAELYGDLAQSWEESPDRLQITIKIKPDVKWHNKAPVNGRRVDIDDVLFSWKRYTSRSPVASLSFNGTNPDAPVLSVNAVDSTSIVIKLKEPLSYALRYFAEFGSLTGNLVMLPKEAESGYDTRNTMIGHGPYELSAVEPSVRYQVKRNPEYWDAGSYFIDQIDMPIAPEYATRLAQLKAGGIHRLIGESGLSRDLLVTKKDQPQLGIYQTDLTASGTVLVFGQLPAGKSPFLDERVRQAMSMAIDRDTWISARYNVEYFESNGLPTETRWNSHMTADWSGYWLDPKGKEFGENAKYFQFNLPEAKKLLAAAGHPNGFSATSNYPVMGFSLASTAEPTDGMLRELGIKVAINNPSYANDYTPNYRDGKGQFEGWTYATVLGTLPNVIHPVAALVAEYWPRGGSAFRGFSSSGSNDQSGDPKLSAMLEKARLEPDTKALQSQLKEIQRYLAKAMWGLLVPGGATSFNMAWPTVRNHRTYRRTRNGNFQEWDPYKLWLDKSQPPN
ncbi:MAG TPA: ABC transporter substrate-binding protein [Dehalococcoidia bacterium]|nr:ABC transporter substrate-binding protein [Dehalococcoidia bacterium]